MKTKTFDSLEKRMLSYSLFAGAVLFGGGSVQAQVWNSGELNEVLSDGQSLTLTFNGSPKFIIRNNAQTGSMSHLTTKAWFACKIYGSAKILYSGNEIKATNQMWNTIAGYRKLFSSTDSFGGGSNVYIGVLLNSGQNPGWIKVNVPNAGRLTFTVIGYAYEQSGTSITINGVLPVELTSFTAAMQSTSALLEWNTATEVNNYGFDIERNAFPENSGSEPSVSEWEKIGFAIGNGNSNSPKSYRFVDGNPPRGLVMYRLKQIDNDGTTSYSPLVTVQNNAPEGFELLQNYPNPFNPSTVIKYTIPQDGYVTLKVYDMLGSEIASVVNETQKAGRHSVNFNAENIPSGTYMYRLQSGDFTETKKLMILK